MPITTPEWVKDAVFYQVFPDRFARSGRVAEPGPLEAWDAPPTATGFKGGDLYGIVERLDDLQALGRHGALPQPGLRLGLQPSLPHVRLHGGRPAAGRRRRPPRADRRLPRARHEGRARRRLQPREPRLLAVQPRAGVRPRLALHRLVPRGPRAAGGGPSAARLPGRVAPAGRRGRRADPRALGRNRVDAGAGLPRLVEPPGPAEAQHGQPSGARVPLRRGRALDPLRGGRLAPGRGRRDRRRRVLARVPPPGQGASIRRPTSSPRSGTRTTAGCRATSSTRT